MSKLDMLTPQNSAIALIDYQPAMYQGGCSRTTGWCRSTTSRSWPRPAKLFKIPTVISTVAAKSFSGLFMPEVTDLFPGHDIIDRTSMNSWLDANFRKAVHATRAEEDRDRRVVDRGLRCVPDPRHVARKASRSTWRPTPAATSRSRRTTGRWSG